MTIKQVIAHLKMLKFINYPHESTIHAYSLTIKSMVILVTISYKRMQISTAHRKDAKWKIVRTNHEQGLRYIAKFLYNLEQENK